LVHGVVWRRSSAMPYHRLQQVDTSQGPLERIADLTTIQLRSAAATTDAAIPGIDPGRVADLRRELLARAGRDDGT
jgi:membrane protein YdbS with pleckstrin-like domain